MQKAYSGRWWGDRSREERTGMKLPQQLQEEMAVARKRAVAVERQRCFRLWTYFGGRAKGLVVDQMLGWDSRTTPHPQVSELVTPL